MRIFVTGASGWIGSPTVAALLQAGHQVVGLARSDASAAKVAALGAEVRRGDLDDLDGLRAAAAAMDRAVIDTVGAALAGTGKPFVIASGVIGLVQGRAATARIGPSAAGAASTASAMRASRNSEPANSTSRLSAKCRKNVRAVSPASAAISATVVCS